MPTGYTAEVQKADVSLHHFVIRCARAFGACTAQRDDGHDAVLKFNRPSDYHSKALAKAKKEQGAYLHACSTKKGKKQLENAFFLSETQAHLSKVKNLAKEATEASRYLAQMGQVLAWTPPTNDHEGIKNFMVEQLGESLHFDHSSVLELRKMPKLETGSFSDYLDKRTSGYIENIEYHEKRLAEDIKRENGRNNWVIDLIVSLNIPPSDYPKYLDPQLIRAVKARLKEQGAKKSGKSRKALKSPKL